MFSLDNAAVQTFFIYSTVLGLKLIFFSVYTSFNRIRRGVFSNPEDTIFGLPDDTTVKFDDVIVERVRRAHLNDLENIPAFWFIGLLYLTTGPIVAWAQWLFRLYAVGRLVHTFVYAIVPVRQPTRAIAFYIPYAVLWYMGLQVVAYYITSL